MARNDNKKTPASQESLFSFGGDAKVPGSSVAAPGQSEREQEAQANSLFSGKKRKDDLGPQYGYKHRTLKRNDEVSVYTEQMDTRYAMDPRTRTLIALFVAVIILVPGLSLLPTGWLTATGLQNGFAGVVDIFQSNLVAFGHLVSGVQDGNGIGILLWQMGAVAIIGAALAINGAVYQGAMKNALASPSTLGVMSGGTLGTIIYTMTVSVSSAEELTENNVVAYTASDVADSLSGLSLPEYIWATQERALFSVIGCFAVVGLVLLIAYIAGRGKVSKSALVIAGQVFAAVISGVVSVVRTYITYYGTDAQLEALQRTVGGSVSNIVGPIQFFLIAIPLIVGFIIVMCLRGRLNLLAFNDDEARSMGISVGRTRVAVIAVCTIMTAVVVSFCGNVGFVGFLIPHIARKVVGPDLRYLIPGAALLGAIYLLIAHYVMSLGNILSGSLGTFTSLVGAIFFIIVLVYQRRRGNVDWV